MKRILFGTIAYVVASFAVQATSHFIVNKAHYASVPFMRPDPILPLGVSTMFLQGLILTHLYGFYAQDRGGWKRGLAFGLLTGAFFVSYPAIAEPAKYVVPSLWKWMAVEGVAGLVQFGLFGALLGWIFHRTAPADAPAHAL